MRRILALALSLSCLGILLAVPAEGSQTDQILSNRLENRVFLLLAALGTLDSVEITRPGEADGIQ